MEAQKKYIEEKGRAFNEYLEANKVILEEVETIKKQIEDPKVEEIDTMKEQLRTSTGFSFNELLDVKEKIERVLNWHTQREELEKQSKEMYSLFKEIQQNTGKDIDGLAKLRNDITYITQLEAISKLKKELEQKNEQLRKNIEKNEEEKAYYEHIGEVKKAGWSEDGIFLLNKKITCVLCGNNFTAYTNKSKNRYYRCLGYKKKVCISKTIKAQKLEEKIKDFYFNTIYNPMIKNRPDFYKKWEQQFLLDQIKYNIFNYSLNPYYQELPLPLSLEEIINNIQSNIDGNLKILKNQIESELKEELIKDSFWRVFRNDELKEIRFNSKKNKGEIIYQDINTSDTKQFPFVL